MNTYKKYCPNVFVAKCDQEYDKWDVILLTTKYWKENECIVHNLVKKDDTHYYYSITRVDGFNSQERAKKKAEKLNGYAINAEKRSDMYYKQSHEWADFLKLAEPIKVWHHSEKRHRALIDRNWKRMWKSVAESEKAESYANRAEYWESMANKINLSMPESIEYFKYKLEQAKENHAKIKATPKEERRHSYSLTYANKEVKELEKKVKIAEKLRG